MNNFDVPPKVKENLEPVFTPELRKKLSDSFMKFLDNRKIPDPERIRFAREVIGIPDADIEAEKGLGIFKGALYDLIESPDFPNGKIKMTLKMFLENLNTIALRSTVDKAKQGNFSLYELSQFNDPISNPISGLQSYSNAVNAILLTLKDVLTPEVNLAIHAFADQIFIKPLNNIVGHKE